MRPGPDRRSPRRWLGLVILVAALAGCTYVQPHVALPGVRLGEPSFFPTIEAYTSTPIVAQNRVDILLNGEEIFPAIIEAVRNARRTIDYAQYYFADGPVAKELTDTIAERCRAGVGGNILLDGFGTLAMPSEYVALMRRSGCHVETFRPIRPLTVHKTHFRNHRRILVVDGRIGFTGGSGVSRKWMGNGRLNGHWRDTDARVEGPVVSQLQSAFAENWLEATGIVLGGEDYFPRLGPAGSAYAHVVRSSPSGGSFAMYTTFLLAVSSARRSIFLTNPYFVPDRQLARAMVDAVSRGVRVVALVPGKIDHNIVRQASRADYGRLLQAGIEIYEYQAALLHAKTMVVDGVWTTIGSTNLDNQSFARSDEINLVVYDTAVARRMEKIFLDDVAYATRVTYEAWRRRGLWNRLQELLVLPLRNLL
jgi:cardiolipin synthase